jgi:hypothetical protein
MKQKKKYSNKIFFVIILLVIYSITLILYFQASYTEISKTGFKKNIVVEKNEMDGLADAPGMGFITMFLGMFFITFILIFVVIFFMLSRFG